ncbi:MAG TPA: hypothetical protein VII23_22340 [Terriglobales bacterium]
MSRADVVSGLVTIAVAGVGYFISGPRVAIAFFALGACGIILVHLFWRDKPKEPVPSVPPSTAPVYHTTISPVINQTANPVVAQNLKPTPADPSLGPRPRLRVLGLPDIVPVGYDLYGVWKVGVGTARGIVLAIQNATPEMGERVGVANDLVVCIDVTDESGNVIRVVSRAHWLGNEGNQISLRSGERSTVLLAVVEDDHLLTFENPRDEAPVYISRRPIPRSHPHYQGHPLQVVNAAIMSVKIVDVEEGETLLEHTVRVTRAPRGLIVA